jgi:hypothetical protein
MVNNGDKNRCHSKLDLDPIGILKVICLFYIHNRLIINLLKLKPELMPH